jgi:hypothetical protein
MHVNVPLTEAEWPVCNDPARMLGVLQDQGRERKLRLFACHCARRIWGVAQDCRGHAIPSDVALAEAYADGDATLTELEAAGENRWGVGEYSSFSCAFSSAQTTTEVDALTAARVASNQSADGFGMVALVTTEEPREKQIAAFLAAVSSEQDIQVALLRDIFGNPFRPVCFDAEWRTSTAVALAQQMYESRDFSTMPILADALQDAGCENPDILNHCRDPKQVHVRGCWIVDAILGKS